ncbi:DUF4231 domain-containing protein [Crocosphaera sp. XPORK-15E]|uniref:DUF4231 domain-containing protein n=1 Tax=Crocosphaera sp. XPORK-15E TaxID=3110247 RepID=UPI002B202B7C|nr:DUF4231 domain-containing protein [Crocosphaera sp. XPORK-15E]
MTTADSPPLNQEFEEPSSTLELRRFLKVLEYLCLDGFCATIILTLFFRDNQVLLVLDAAFLSGFVFLFLFNWQYFSYRDQVEREQKYEQLIQPLPASENRIQLEKENALRYCQELVEDYTKTRENARNGYYFFQISTIIFSGVTPVLVLVDKLDTGPSWLTWLPVIFPAIASIVASISTSFPLETIWKDANSIVENLEAEQEKFILGITSEAMLDIVATDVSEGEQTEEEKQKIAQQVQQQERRAKLAIIDFINKVNDIHLNQVKTQVQTVQNFSEIPPEKVEEEAA